MEQEVVIPVHLHIYFIKTQKEHRDGRQGT